MIMDRFPELLSGLLLSLQITGLALVIGMPLGLVLASLASSRHQPIRVITTIIVEVGRGAPALVVLQLVYYGLPATGVSLESLPSAWLALSVTTAAYTSEILRAGLQSIATGQREAVAALGLGRVDGFRFVVLPQALRVSIPAMLGFGIQIFQATSLAFAIAVPELLSRAYSIGSATFRYLPVLLLAGALYAVISVPVGWGVTVLERRLSRHLTP